MQPRTPALRSQKANASRSAKRRSKSASQASAPRKTASGKPVAFRASLFSDKRGIEIVPESAVQIIIGIIAVIAAIAVFAALYRMIFGGTATEDDAKTLAAIIAEMADSEKQYEQRAVLLRIDDNWIYGFDKATNNPQVRTVYGYENKEARLSRPEMCSNDDCICSVSSDGKSECFLIKPKSLLRRLFENNEEAANIGSALDEEGNRIPLHLVSDYAGYAVMLSPKTIPQDTIYPYESGRYSGFIAGAPLTDLVRVQTRRTRVAEETEAVMPVIIEKRIIKVAEGKKAVIITLLPDTTTARNRNFYMQVCERKEGSDERCAGLTGWRSTERFITGDARQYCATGFDDECSLQPLEICANGRAIREPCWCGDRAVTYGVCNEGVYAQIQCQSIKACDDYCKHDGSTAVDGDRFSDLDHCTVPETSMCSSNPCALPVSCALKLNNNIEQCRIADEEREQMLREIAENAKLIINAQRQAANRLYADQAIYIEKDLKLVGFSTGGIEDQRPAICTGKACICITAGDEISQCEVIATSGLIDVAINADLDDGTYLLRVQESGEKFIVSLESTQGLTCSDEGTFAASCGFSTKETTPSFEDTRKVIGTVAQDARCCVPDEE